MAVHIHRIRKTVRGGDSLSHIEHLICLDTTNGASRRLFSLSSIAMTKSTTVPAGNSHIRRRSTILCSVVRLPTGPSDHEPSLSYLNTALGRDDVFDPLMDLSAAPPQEAGRKIPYSDRLGRSALTHDHKDEARTLVEVSIILQHGDPDSD